MEGASYSPGRTDRLLVLVLAACFLALAWAEFLAGRASPATGYEISLYTALPPGVWIVLCTCMAAGIAIIVREAFFPGPWRLWIPAFFLLILVNTVILSMQIVRDYFLYGINDPLGHYGIAANILARGQIGDNYYPVLHLFSGTITELAGLPLGLTMKMLPIFFTLLFALFCYLLGREICGDGGAAILVAAASVPLFFSYYHLAPYPHAMGILLFPLFFTIYFRYLKQPSAAHFSLLLLIMLLYTFIHPLIEVILIAALFGGEAARVIWNWRMGRRGAAGSFNPALIAMCTFFLWFMYFTASGIPAQQITRNVAQESVQTIKRANELEPVLTLDLYHFVELTVKMYGQLIVVLAGAVLAGAIILYLFWKKDRESRDLFILFSLFLTCLVTYIVMANRTGLVTWGRIFSANAGVWAMPVLAGFAAYWLLRDRAPGPRAAGAVLVTLILVSAAFIGVFNVYRSPWINQPNWQMTRHDLAGSNWFSGHELTDQIGNEQMGLGLRAPSTRIPRHFGYQRESFLGLVIPFDTSIVLTKRFVDAAADPAIQEFTSAPPNVARQGFDPGDFARLEADPTVDKVYSNGELTVYIAHYRD